MAASRPNWKGHLKLSFVSCPIALYPAISATERLAFRQVNRRTGNRLRQQLVDTVTGETVEASSKGRGYEIADNQFLLVEDDELEKARDARPPPRSVTVVEPPSRKTAGVQQPSVPREPQVPTEEEAEVTVARPENTHTIEIEKFLSVGQVDSRYYEKPYYITPRNLVGQEAYAVIRDAMREQGLMGLGRVVLASRERPILVEPMGRGLRGTTLRFAHEIRSEEDYFRDIPI